MTPKQRAEQAREKAFPKLTTPAHRNVHIIADCLSRGFYSTMLQGEPRLCADDIYSVLADLWEARVALEKATAPTTSENQ